MIKGDKREGRTCTNKEDLYDSLIARLRADDPRESLESVKERLRRQGKHIPELNTEPGGDS